MHNTGVACAYNYDYSEHLNLRVIVQPIDIYGPTFMPDWLVGTLEGQWEALIEFLGGYDNAGGPLKAGGTLEAGDGLWLEPI